MSKYRKMWEWLVDMGIATEEELILVTCLTGRSIETLNNVLFIRTGYRTREQYEYSELWDEEKENG